MASIKLGNRPKSFKRIVTFPLIEGGEGAIEVSFRYRTRTEFGAFIDKISADAKDSGEQKDFTIAELMGKTRDKNAQYLMDVIDGWNLDEPMTRATVEQLCDELPGAAAEIMEAYRKAIVEGRLGN